MIRFYIKTQHIIPIQKADAEQEYTTIDASVENLEKFLTEKLGQYSSRQVIGAEVLKDD